MCWWLMQSSFSTFRAVLPWWSWAAAELICGEIFWRRFSKWLAIQGFPCLLRSLHPKITKEGDQIYMAGITLSYSGSGLTFRFYSPVQTPPCHQIPLGTPVSHIEIFVCYSLNFMIKLCLPAHYYSMKMVPLAFARTFQGACSLERQHMEKHTSACVGMGRGCWFLSGFCFFPLATWAAKTCNLQELEAPCRKLARSVEELRSHFSWLIKGLMVQRFRVNCQCATEESLWWLNQTSD